MKRPTLSDATLEIVPKDGPLAREQIPESREGGLDMWLTSKGF